MNCIDREKSVVFSAGWSRAAREVRWDGRVGLSQTASEELLAEQLSRSPRCSFDPGGEKKGSPGLGCGCRGLKNVCPLGLLIFGRRFLLSFRNAISKLLNRLVFEEFGFKVCGFLL